MSVTDIVVLVNDNTQTLPEVHSVRKNVAKATKQVTRLQHTRCRILHANHTFLTVASGSTIHHRNCGLSWLQLKASTGCGTPQTCGSHSRMNRAEVIKPSTRYSRSCSALAEPFGLLCVLRKQPMLDWPAPSNTRS